MGLDGSVQSSRRWPKCWAARGVDVGVYMLMAVGVAIRDARLQFVQECPRYTPDRPVSGVQVSNHGRATKV